MTNPAGVRSLGYALFTRQGMAAWARAWRSYTIIEPPAPASPPVAAAVPHSVPLELRTQVAVVLAGIIFHLQTQEVCSC
ncbi:MAG: hypothetical protein JO182_32545 [Acidobacteriaceae bacterium]|nr:hypothetical protein [Acidobacteriaceae bacterium]MBV9039258.1 hypothetical protein [Acidobacteriaceae bacterium]